MLLRSLTEDDFEAWHEVRARCADWLLRWEPRPKGAPVPSEDRASFAARCGIRERERQLGTGYGFGIFVGERFAGEITLSSIQRGPFQSAFIGYWIDEALAGRGSRPRRSWSRCASPSRRSRCTGSRSPSSRGTSPADGWSRSSASARRASPQRYLEIDGVWEDHVRYAITAEEWAVRGAEPRRGVARRV